jgi:hypothetical protein
VSPGWRRWPGFRPVSREALYLPALVAVRFKAKYDALRAVGKPAKLVTAIVQKLAAQGLLREVKRTNQAGHMVSKLQGPRVWMAAFMMPSRTVVRFPHAGRQSENAVT